jgi:hypothetical protein
MHHRTRLRIRKYILRFCKSVVVQIHLLHHKHGSVLQEDVMKHRLILPSAFLIYHFCVRFEVDVGHRDVIRVTV